MCTISRTDMVVGDKVLVVGELSSFYGCIGVVTHTDPYLMVELVVCGNEAKAMRMKEDEVELLYSDLPDTIGVDGMRP